MYGCVAAIGMLKPLFPIGECVLTILIAATSAPAQITVHSAPLDITHDKPFVMVMINGKGPFRFVVDTGTGGEAFVTSQLAEELGLTPSGQIRLSDPTGQGAKKVPMVVLQTLRIAGVEFTGVKAAVHNLGSEDGYCQGLIGFLLFRDYLMTLDYPNRRIELSTGDLDLDGERSVLPFRMPDGIPIISLSVGTAQIDAQLDSGGEGLSLPIKLVSKLKFVSGSASLSKAQSLSTRFVVAGASLGADVRLASYTFKRPFIEINPVFPVANFGAAPMQSFALTFDQKNGLVRFVADRHTLHLNPTPDPVRLVNAPSTHPPDLSLVPVG
jgi:predicted aspartyl protease